METSLIVMGISLWLCTCSFRTRKARLTGDSVFIQGAPSAASGEGACQCVHVLGASHLGGRHTPHESVSIMRPTPALESARCIVPPDLKNAAQIPMSALAHAHRDTREREAVIARSELSRDLVSIKSTRGTERTTLVLSHNDNGDARRSNWPRADQASSGWWLRERSCVFG